VPYEKVNNPAKTYEKEIGMLTEKIRLAMDRGCHIKYEFVNDIAPTSSGKYRYIISKVKCNDK
jgi:phenylacetate-CoA ligase